MYEWLGVPGDLGAKDRGNLETCGCIRLRKAPEIRGEYIPLNPENSQMGNGSQKIRVNRDRTKRKLICFP